MISQKANPWTLNLSREASIPPKESKPFKMRLSLDKDRIQRSTNEVIPSPDMISSFFN